jgi:hypothetical protein
MKRCGLIVFMALAAGVRGQTPTPAATGTPEAPRQVIWRCELPGGTYEVAVHAMISVSSHEYVVDGVARVTEVNVDTQGNMAVRFYYLEPITPNTPSGVGQSAIDKISDLAKEAAGRVDQEKIWERVVKSYPTTTHTHTIEYRLESEEQLKKIFASADNAFRTGRGATIKLKD